MEKPPISKVLELARQAAEASQRVRQLCAEHWVELGIQSIFETHSQCEGTK